VCVLEKEQATENFQFKYFVEQQRLSAAGRGTAARAYTSSERRTSVTLPRDATAVMITCLHMRRFMNVFCMVLLGDGVEECV